MNKKWIIALILLVGVVLGYLYLRENFERIAFRPTESVIEEGVRLEEVADEPTRESIEVIADNLEIPWGITFLPTGEMLVTERPGRLSIIGDEKVEIPIQGVQESGESGLHGIALHPQFEQNRFLYLYLTTAEGEGLINRVERYRFTNNQLSDRTVIIDQIPGAIYHDGGGIAFGPDGYLYITTGDARNPESAQDLTSLAGKTLRLHDDGRVPDDNPFGTAVWAYGHRNAQGLAWDTLGRLWQTEHGRSGVLSGFDELNLVEKGVNYGWPVIQGPEEREGMVAPVVQSGAEETWAPAALAYVPHDDGGSLFFTGLRGESIYEARLDANGEVKEFMSHFRSDFGRLRAIALGPDGALYVSTSNQDGRGSVREGDDKIIRFDLSVFE